MHPAMRERTYDAEHWSARRQGPPGAQAPERAGAASELGPQTAPLRAGRVGGRVAIAGFAQRAHVAGGGGRGREAQLERVQGRAGRGLAAGATQRALELGQCRPRAAAPMADAEEAERAGAE